MALCSMIWYDTPGAMCGVFCKGMVWHGILRCYFNIRLQLCRVVSCHVLYPPPPSLPPSLPPKIEVRGPTMAACSWCFCCGAAVAGCGGWNLKSEIWVIFSFSSFFPHISTFHLLDKPWSQVSSLLHPGSCLQFLSRREFSNPTARRFSSSVSNSRSRASRKSICDQEKVPTNSYEYAPGGNRIHEIDQYQAQR